MTIEKQIDELTKEQFIFWINGNLIILSSYYFLTRENTRKRNYTVIKKYDTIRSSNIPSEEVPLTEEIKEEALSEYVKSLKVVTWAEYKSK